MGERARGARATLLRLARAGIELHVQIVLCPGWNDGAALDETVLALAAVEAVEDVGVVPVSLAPRAICVRVRRPTPRRRWRWSRGLAPTLAAGGGATTSCTPPTSSTCWPATNRRAPTAELQYENGIGMSAAASRRDGRARCRPTGERRWLCSPARWREPVIASAPAALLVAAGVTPAARPFVVANDLFGAHVTVTGLLGGREVLAALRGAAAGRRRVAARAARLAAGASRAHAGRRRARREAAAACGGRLAPRQPPCATLLLHWRDERTACPSPSSARPTPASRRWSTVSAARVRPSCTRRRA